MSAWQHTLERSTTCRACGDSYKFYIFHWKKSRDRTQKLCGPFCVPDLFDELDTRVLIDFILQFFTFIVVDIWHCSHQTSMPTTWSLGWPQTVCCCYSSSDVTSFLFLSTGSNTHSYLGFVGWQPGLLFEEYWPSQFVSDPVLFFKGNFWFFFGYILWPSYNIHVMYGKNVTNWHLISV
jgi:hypothetical protein